MTRKVNIVLLLLFAGCFLPLSGGAQVRYVSSPSRGNGNGESWENASSNIGEMLAQGSEVRVALGTYVLNEELFVPAGKRLTGGWFDGERVESGTENTVLEARGEHRVATVAGLLEGVTVTKGLAVREDGGGLLVESTGEVRNCIVRNNRSARYYPQVGDYLDKDGNLIPQAGLTPSNMPDVRAVVFWVNPDTLASKGNRGWAVAVPDGPDGELYSGPMDFVTTWAETDGILTDHACATLREALADTAGWANTQRIVANSDPETTSVAQACLDYGRAGEEIRWYLPALGQLRHLVSELLPVYASYARLIQNDAYQSLIMYKPSYSSTEVGDNAVWSIQFDSDYYNESGYNGVNKTRRTIPSNFQLIPITSF